MDSFPRFTPGAAHERVEQADPALSVERPSVSSAGSAPHRHRHPPMSSSLLREEDNQELRSIFDAFDHNSDGLLDVDEVAAILHSFGKPMTEAEVRRSLRPTPGPGDPCAWPLDRRAGVLDKVDGVRWQVLDMVTELKPELKKLPFEDFVNVMCRPMVSEAALREEVKEVFGLFAGAGNSAITAASLQEVMGSLDHPVSKLLVRACAPGARTCLRGAGLHTH